MAAEDFISLLRDLCFNSEENQRTFNKAVYYFKSFFEGQFDMEKPCIFLDSATSLQLRRIRNEKLYYFNAALVLMLNMVEEINAGNDEAADFDDEKIVEGIYKTYHYETREMRLFKDLSTTGRHYCRSPFFTRIPQKFRSLITGIPPDTIGDPYSSEICVECGCRIGPAKLLCRKCHERRMTGKTQAFGIRNPAKRVMSSRTSDLFLEMESFIRESLCRMERGILQEDAVLSGIRHITGLREGICNNINSLSAGAAMMPVEMDDPGRESERTI